MPNSQIELILEKSLPFWDKLSENETALLLSGTRPVHYAAGETVHSPHAQCLGVLLVKQGSLRTYLLSENGKEVTLFRLESGNTCVLSAACLLDSVTFEVFVEAEKESEALLLDAGMFAQLQAQNPHVENYALHTAVERFSDVMWAVEQILFMRFDQRLAAFLLDETAKTHSSRLVLTHEQIAKYIGSAREVVSRMLKYFEKEGMVALYRGGLEISGRPALQRLVREKGK